MSTLLVQSGTLDDIADAIRAKTGKVASMTPLEMPQEIASISGGGGVNILSGTSDPTSAQGNNKQIFLKHADFEEDYTFKEYLEVGNTAGPYLDTGIYFKSSQEYEVKIQMFDTQIENTVHFGCWVSGKDTMIYYYNSKIGFLVGGSGVAHTMSFDTNPHIYKAERSALKVDGSSVGNAPNWNNVPTTAKYYMFKDTAHNPAKNTRIYYAKIWDNGTLIANFVPVERKSDNVYGMLNLVDGTFITNSGSGSFSVGSTSSSVSAKPILSAQVKKDGNWQDLIGTDIEDVDLGSGGGSIPFEKEIQHSLVQVQTANPVPVSVTFSKEFSIGFVCGLTADNVGNGDVSFSNGLKMGTISHNNQAQISAGFIPVPANKVLTGFFPYSDGGAYYEILGAIGMSKLPSEHYFGFTSANSNISISLDKVYDHIVVFVGMDDDSSGTTLAMNGNAITMTEESYLYGRYTYHCAVETTSDSNTLAFTYSDSVNDSTIVVFAYNE